MRLRSKVTAFFMSLALVAGVYFFSLPTQQRVCAQAAAPQCSAAGGSCTGRTACEGPLAGQVLSTLDCTGGNVCCRYNREPVVPLPNEMERLQDANKLDLTNGTSSKDSFLSRQTTVDLKTQKAVGGDGVLQIVAGGLGGMLMIDPDSFNQSGATSQAGGDSVVGQYYTPNAMGSAVNLTASVFSHSPASSVEYIADVIQNLKHPLGEQTAYAQGLGFSALNPVLSLWKLSRNIAYFFFVIIFMAVGFLIMIRSKIGSQAAITVQQALPKLVVSLLLVTFSYAIAGLMLDLMYIGIYLIVGVFSTQFPNGIKGIIGAPGVIGGNTPLIDVAFKNDIFANSVGFITNGTSGSVAQALGRIIQSTLQGLGWNEQIAGVVRVGADILFFLVLAVVILVSMFRTFFALLKAYIGIFFSVIFAPIQLLIGALPGQNTFGAWIKGLLENIIVFPVIITMIFIAYFFNLPNKGSGGFVAPQLGSNQSNDGLDKYRSLISLGIILAMPEIAKIAKGVMQGKLEIDPSSLVNSLKANTQVGLPIATGAYGAGAGGIGAVVDARRRGELTRRNAVGTFFKGRMDSSGKRQGGFGAGFTSGGKTGNKIAGFVDNLAEGKVFDQNATSNLLERLVKSDEERKKEREEASKGGATRKQ